MPRPRKPSSQPIETEAKIRVESTAEVRRALSRNGGRRVTPRALEKNTLFDVPDGSIRASGRALRVRSYRASGSITLKGAAKVEGGTKSRMEIETEVATPGAVEAILSLLGFVPVFRYEKFRETWRVGKAVVCLDDTPLGCFIEIEGDSKSIPATAKKLGFDTASFLTDSYPALWRAAGRTGDMVFTAKARA